MTVVSLGRATSAKCGGRADGDGGVPTPNSLALSVAALGDMGGRRGRRGARDGLATAGLNAPHPNDIE